MHKALVRGILVLCIVAISSAELKHSLPNLNLDDHGENQVDIMEDDLQNSLGEIHGEDPVELIENTNQDQEVTVEEWITLIKSFFTKREYDLNKVPKPIGNMSICKPFPVQDKSLGYIISYLLELKTVPDEIQTAFMNTDIIIYSLISVQGEESDSLTLDQLKLLEQDISAINTLNLRAMNEEKFRMKRNQKLKFQLSKEELERENEIRIKKIHEILDSCVKESFD